MTTRHSFNDDVMHTSRGGYSIHNETYGNTNEMENTRISEMRDELMKKWHNQKSLRGKGFEVSKPLPDKISFH